MRAEHRGGRRQPSPIRYRAEAALAADDRAADGLWSCSPEHLLLARILGERPLRTRSTPGRIDPGAITRTRAEQLDSISGARAARRRDQAIRHLRTLCEDADELLGQAAEAARRGDAEAAAEPLAEVRRVAAAILRQLRRPVPAACAAAGHATLLDENQVLAMLAVVEELDSQLRDARIGYRGAGWRAGRLAEKVLIGVDRLSAAAGSGRTRAHASAAPSVAG